MLMVPRPAQQNTLRVTFLLTPVAVASVLAGNFAYYDQILNWSYEYPVHSGNSNRTTKYF